MPIRISFDDVTVRFGAVHALAHLSLSLRAGEIVGLLGHNGAGKSTLVNVATGAVRASRGTITVDGDAVGSRTSPSQFSSLGVHVVHQEPALSSNLSVEENLFLGAKSGLSRASRRKAARTALASVGVVVDLGRPVGTLSIAQRQLVDIARHTLIGKTNVLFLDEPTAALGTAETERLHELIRGFAESGAAVAYVSHRLADVMNVCDRIVVLRDGRPVLDRPVSGFTTDRLARALAPDLQLMDYNIPEVGELRISVKARAVHCSDGEIVGLFGMAGGDQFKMLESMFGLAKLHDLELDGEQYLPKKPRDAMRKGVFMLQADRERHSLARGLSAIDNIFLPWLREKEYNDPIRGIRQKSLRRAYGQARRTLNIVGPKPEAPISAFSGGNRQKHVVARWMMAMPPRVLLLAQPTQGVDVGARMDIVRALRGLTASGTCILVASAEADEIATLCDRAYVVGRSYCSEVARSERFEEDLVNELLRLAERESAGHVA